MEYEDMTAKEMYQELKRRLTESGKIYLFLDEVQEVADWEKAVNSLVSDYDVDLYVTGSNSRMMSSEISTYLTGRYVAFRIYTLSFAEYLAFKRQYASLVDIHAELANYIRLGGFPATHLREYSQDEVYTIVRDIYNSTVFSDIVRRNRIRKVDRLERVVKYAFSNVGNTFSAKSVSGYLKAEHQALENVVYLELCRRGYTVYVGKQTGGENNFMAVRQNEKLYVRVTQRIESEKTERRKYERLLEIRDNYPKYVLRTDEFAGGNYQGIKKMQVADFLLSTEY